MTSVIIKTLAGKPLEVPIWGADETMRQWQERIAPMTYSVRVSNGHRTFALKLIQDNKILNSPAQRNSRAADVIDCTRPIYGVHWDFDPTSASQMLGNLDTAGVDIEACAICMCEFEWSRSHRGTVTTFPCMHRFHAACAVRIERIEGCILCPTCQADVTGHIEMIAALMPAAALMLVEEKSGD